MPADVADHQCGPPQSLVNVVIPMIERWQRLSKNGTILTGRHRRLRASRRDQGRDPEPSSAGVGRGLHGGSRTDASPSAASVCRSFATGCCASTPADGRAGRSAEVTRAHPRSSNADHRRALAEVVEAGPVPPSTASVRSNSRKDLDVASWRRSPSRSTDHGRARVEGIGFADPARPRHYAQNELAVESFKKNFNRRTGEDPARLPKGVEIELWWQDEARIGQ